MATDETATNLKLLVWTRAEPDNPSGSPAILSTMLSFFLPTNVQVVCEWCTPKDKRRQIDLPYRVTRLRFWPFRRGSRIAEWLNFLLFPLMIWIGIWRVWRFRPDCLLTIYYNWRWILSSYLISRLTGVPVAYYVHDPYRETAEARGGWQARLARWLEPCSLRHGIRIVLCDSLKSNYLERYGLSSHVVRHPLDIHQLPPQETEAASTENRELRVAFAGSVYANNADMMADLAAAANAIEKLQLIIYSPNKPEIFWRMGFRSETTTICFEADYTRLVGGLADADLLYLPLSFVGAPDLPRESLRFALPTKAVDYLASRNQILVHCPADYELATFFRNTGAAHVVTDPGAPALADWLRRWRNHELDSIPKERIMAALQQFDARRNFVEFVRVIEHEAKRT